MQDEQLAAPLLPGLQFINFPLSMRLLHHTGKLPNITPLQSPLKKLKNVRADPQYKVMTLRVCQNISPLQLLSPW